MEIRKIQNTASGSFFITLPKSWVSNLEINKGDDLIISIDKDESLKIIPLKRQESNKNNYTEFHIPIENYPEENSLERALNASYVQGADVITISSKNTISSEKKKLIKNCTSNLIGTEIAEELANKINVRILVDPVKFPLSNLIERIYSLVSSMHMDARKSFQERDEILAEDVINREKEVDKLFFLMLRQLNLSLNNKINLSDICTSDMKIDCVLGIVLARDLSKMAHYAVEIANQARKIKDKQIDPQLIEHLVNMSNFVMNMQRNAILAFFKNDFMRANEVINNIFKVREFDDKTEEAILNTTEDTATTISLITISKNLRNIANSAVAVSEDLQAKYRPEVTQKKESISNNLPNPMDLITSLGYKEEET